MEPQKIKIVFVEVRHACNKTFAGHRRPSIRGGAAWHWEVYFLTGPNAYKTPRRLLEKQPFNYEYNIIALEKQVDLTSKARLLGSFR